MSKEVLQEALELLAVATFITPKLQAKRTEVINAGLQALERPAHRKPLYAGEISRLWKQHTNEDGPHHNPYDDDGLGFARAIEAAHGIKDQQPK